jgi:dihydroflavonol-4-reductase
MRIFIVGGTGFLGYYSALEFLRRGHSVSTISLPDIPLGNWFPKEIMVNYGDIFKMNTEELHEIFHGYDAMVYAVGPDDRVTPKAPAYEFFHDRLVVACTKVVTAARDAGIKRCVVLNSYFAYFDRIWPEKKLKEKHAYIRCRVEQADAVIKAGDNKMAVMVLELPYIFGKMPERVPLWKEVLLDRLLKMKTIYYPEGGTIMITVEHIAEAIVGAIEQGQHGKRYPIGDINMTWSEMITIMLNAIGQIRKINPLPKFIANIVGRSLYQKDKKQGKESGLNPSHFFQDIQCQYLFFDPSETAKELGYNRGGIKEALELTAKSCYPVK